MKKRGRCTRVDGSSAKARSHYREPTNTTEVRRGGVMGWGWGARNGFEKRAATRDTCRAIFSLFLSLLSPLSPPPPPSVGGDGRLDVVPFDVAIASIAGARKTSLASSRIPSLPARRFLPSSQRRKIQEPEADPGRCALQRGRCDFDSSRLYSRLCFRRPCNLVIVVGNIRCPGIPVPLVPREDEEDFVRYLRDFVHQHFR